MGALALRNEAGNGLCRRLLIVDCIDVMDALEESSFGVEVLLWSTFLVVRGVSICTFFRGGPNAVRRRVLGRLWRERARLQEETFWGRKLHVTTLRNVLCPRRQRQMRGSTTGSDARTRESM